MSVIAAEGKLLGGYSAGLGKRLVRKKRHGSAETFCFDQFFRSVVLTSTHGPPFNPVQWVQCERYNKSNFGEKYFQFF